MEARVLVRAFLMGLAFASFMAEAEQDTLATAFYVFGDSLSDSGNNNYLPTIAKANYPPYGIDIKNGIGRFTNGRTVADLLAEFLKLPYPPPYLSLSEKERSKTLTGINYASGSAGILPETGSRLGKCLHFHQQIDFFKNTIQNDLKSQFKDEESLRKYLDKSIFKVFIGSNDYINNYLQEDFYNSSKRYSPEEFSKLLIDKLSEGLKKLYKLGGRKFVVFETGAIECMPTIVNTVGNGKCVKDLSRLVNMFNSKIRGMLRHLQSNLPRSTFVLANISSFANKLFQNPKSYEKKTGDNSDTSFYGNWCSLMPRFTEARKSCCKSGINSTTTCLPGTSPCKNRSKYIFYDAFHPTEAVNVIVAKHCFKESLCLPINLRELAKI